MIVTYSDFTLECSIHSNTLHETLIASVIETKTTGMLWWKKTTQQRRQVARVLGEDWFFVDSGMFTPGFVIQDLERMSTIRNMLDRNAK